ncbi:MAG: hypothetical protein IJP92_11900 [Lachnospiraceae bacterium]|nr:hypothetical protein [Lachnospiraceae bacterium]
MLHFLIDTGAKYTCCYHRHIDRNLREEAFHHAERKRLGGFVSGDEMIFYACDLKQMTIGDIDL